MAYLMLKTGVRTIEVSRARIEHVQDHVPGLASLPDSRFLGERFDTLAFEEARAGLTVEHRFNSNWRIESRLRWID